MAGSGESAAVELKERLGAFRRRASAIGAMGGLAAAIF
jgi:hypothetical protein